jgi:nucleotide-binding universal stress UspA family protein
VLPRLDRILVPIDFSKASLSALETAVALLKGNDSARLTLLHVVQPVPALAVADAGLPPSFDVESFVDHATAELKGIGQSHGDEVKITVRVVVGSPAQEIVQLCGNGDFDLIVMSSHGRSGVRRLLLGSVAESVVNGSRASVLVVKEPLATDRRRVLRFRRQRLRNVAIG